MPLRFLLDENIPKSVWTTVVRHNLRGRDPIDLMRVGLAGAPTFGTLDPDLLLWSEKQGRIILSGDKKTMPAHLEDHLRAGHRSPGVMVLRPRVHLSELLEFLRLASYASTEEEWADRITYVP